LTKLPVSIFKRIRLKLKFGLMMEVVLDQLGHWGLIINPYYVFREGLFDGKPKEFAPEFGKYETTFLAPEDMKKIDRIDGRHETEVTLLERLRQGNKCLAVKIAGEILGFTWCNLDIFNQPSKYLFRLKDNEAYLFDAYVLKSHRGLNLAPFMRLHLYQELDKMGRDVLYSISNYFNAPAIRFKKKLGARVVKLCLYIRVTKRFHWHWIIKSYE
jgi:ribosomal protein S18 acetylase RimI-like enzyme